MFFSWSCFHFIKYKKNHQFIKTNITFDNKFLVLHPLGNYFVKDKTDSNTKYDREAIIRMLNFLMDNIFVVFGGTVVQQTI